MATLDVGRGIEHFLHSRTSLWTFVGDDHTVATLHFSSEDALAGCFLRIEDSCGSAEFPDVRVDTGCLDHATVLSDVAEEYSQTAVLRVSMLQGADASMFTIRIERFPLGVLAAHLRGELTAGCAMIDAACLFLYVIARDVVGAHSLSKGGAVNTTYRTFDESATIQLVHNAKYATGTVALLHAVLLRVWSQLAKARHMTTETVDVRHRKVYASLLRHGKKMEDSVGAAAHGNVERHGIEERLTGGNAARKNRVVAILIVSKGVLHNLTCCVAEKTDTIGMRGKDGAVAGQSQSDGFGERVHRVGGEHS